MGALEILLLYYLHECVYNDEFDMSPEERRRQERRARRKLYRVTSKAGRGRAKTKKNEDVPSAIYLISKPVIPAGQRKDVRKQTNRNGRKNKVKDNAQAETGNDIDRKGADESKIIVADESSTVYSVSTVFSEASRIIPKNLMKVQKEQEAKRKAEQRRRDHDKFMKDSMEEMKQNMSKLQAIIDAM